jgi:SAM-dependent methyltransferase
MFLRENEEGQRIAPFLEPGDTLLDIGAGTGFMARWLSRRTGVTPTLTDLVRYRNRDPCLPFLQQSDAFHVPVGDSSFDVVLLMFVFHHMEDYADQERLLDEAKRISSRRIVIAEDTPTSSIDRAFNVAWDWVLNIRHGVPTPFTFRSADGWVEVFKREDLSIVHQETYRPVWPTLGTYHHTLFVLDG